MRYGGGFRALAALLLIGFIALVGAGAYGAGFAAGQVSPTVGAPSPAWAYGCAFGIGHVIGFLVTILVLVIMIRLIVVVLFGSHRHHGWARHGYWHGEGDADRFGPGGFGPGGPGGPGPWGGWHRSEWREAGQARFDELHNRSHGYPPPAGGPATGGPATGDPATGGPATGSQTTGWDQPR
jgi:hypothetical protein